MACFLKVLSDMVQSPQPLSHIHICPKPKVKLGPTDLIYPAPPCSVDIVLAFLWTQCDLITEIENIES